MRSCIRVHCSENGRGVSVTRGSSNPSGVWFIARAALDSTWACGSLRLRKAKGVVADTVQDMALMQVSALTGGAEWRCMSNRYRKAAVLVANQVMAGSCRSGSRSIWLQANARPSFATIGARPRVSSTSTFAVKDSPRHERGGDVIQPQL